MELVAHHRRIQGIVYYAVVRTEREGEVGPEPGTSEGEEEPLVFLSWSFFSSGTLLGDKHAWKLKVAVHVH